MGKFSNADGPKRCVQWKLDFGRHMCAQPGFENLRPEDFIQIYDSFLRIVWRELRTRGIVTIPGIATLETYVKPRRLGINNKTREVAVVPSMMGVKGRMTYDRHTGKASRIVD